jgi:hypothetical protein
VKKFKLKAGKYGTLITAPEAGSGLMYTIDKARKDGRVVYNHKVSIPFQGALSNEYKTLQALDITRVNIVLQNYGTKDDAFVLLGGKNGLILDAGTIEPVSNSGYYTLSFSSGEEKDYEPNMPLHFGVGASPEFTFADYSQIEAAFNNSFEG